MNNEKNNNLEENSSLIEKFSDIYDKLKNKDLSYLFEGQKIDIKVDKTITFLLTRTCDKKCSHCLASINKTKDKLDFELIEKTFIELKKHGVENLIISGGEAFIHLDDFPRLFSLLKKYKLKIRSLKTNMYLSETDNYEQKFMDAYKNNEDIFSGAIEPSLDRFHGNTNQLNQLLKIINLNFKIIKNSNLVEKKMMNISMIRELDFSKDINDLENIINYFANHFSLNLEVNLPNQNKSIINQKAIINYIRNNITQDYFILKLRKNGKELIIRFGLNDLYKIGKAEKLESNLVEKQLNKHTGISELYRYSDYNIKAIDEKGDIYTDEFSVYTKNFYFGNIEDSIESFINKNNYNPVLIELKNNGLTRLLPKLLVIYPELKSFSYVIYDDIFQKILSLKNAEKILFCLCCDLLSKEK